MPRVDTETPRRATEIPAIWVTPTVEDSIGMFKSESESEDEPRDSTPPTGYRPAIAEEIHPPTQRGTGVLIGASVLLLVTLLGVALMRNRQHLTPPAPLDLTPSAQSTAPEERTPAAPTAPPAVAVVPPSETDRIRDVPEAPARTPTTPATVVERRAVNTPPPAPIVEETPAPVPTVPIEPPTAPAAATVEALAPPPPPAMTAPPAVEESAVAAVTPPPPPPAVPSGSDLLTSDRAAITRTLDVYRESYSALDASAVSMIWVGLDTRALQRAFSTLSRQDLEFDHCDLDIAAARNKARASCTGVLNYVRRIGSADEHQRQMSWAIDLVRSSDRWLIQNVTAR